MTQLAISVDEYGIFVVKLAVPFEQMQAAGRALALCDGPFYGIDYAEAYPEQFDHQGRQLLGWAGAESTGHGVSVFAGEETIGEDIVPCIGATGQLWSKLDGTITPTELSLQDRLDVAAAMRELLRAAERHV